MCASGVTPSCCTKLLRVRRSCTAAVQGAWPSRWTTARTGCSGIWLRCSPGWSACRCRVSSRRRSSAMCSTAPASIAWSPLTPRLSPSWASCPAATACVSVRSPLPRRCRSVRRRSPTPPVLPVSPRACVCRPTPCLPWPRACARPSPAAPSSATCACCRWRPCWRTWPATTRRCCSARASNCRRWPRSACAAPVSSSCRSSSPRWRACARTA
ncbi:hypothetical protein D9M71_241760 [compost metagenome]